MSGQPKIAVPPDALAAFCRKWMITELALFGSVLGDDFGPESDIDVMVVFRPDAPWTYMDWPAMQDELSEIFQGRTIDIIERKCIRNPFIRHHALTHRNVIYAA